VETNLTGPYAVTFVFVNNNPESSSFLREDCHLQMSVKSCADGYSSPVQMTADCSASCEDYNGCIACGACPYGYSEVTSTNSPKRDWAGYTYTFDTAPDGCTCHDTHQARAGKYRVEVPVYASGDAEFNDPPVFTASAEFTLPAENNVVYVDVSLPWAAN